MATLPRLLAPVAVGAALIAVTATLNGCASLSDALLHRHEERFADYASAEKGWVGVEMPSWIPRDATELRSVATADEGRSVVRVTTASEPVGDCGATERVSVPFVKRAWIPDAARTADGLQECGAYQLVRTDDGWVGWFQARERGERPDDPAAPGGEGVPN